METQYKLYLSGRNIYREIELSSQIQRIRIGTSTDCEARLRPDLFFESFYLDLVQNNENWTLSCSDNIYISLGDVRKYFTMALEHGSSVSIHYQNSSAELFKLTFSIDFERNIKKYDTYVDLNEVESLKIGSDPNCDITLHSDYIKNEYFTIRKIDRDFVLVKDNTRYGVYLNGIKIETDCQLKENDFFSLADCFFCYSDRRLYTDGGENICFNTLKPVSVEESTNHMNYPQFNRSTRIYTKLNEEKIPILDPQAAPQKPNSNIVMQLLPAVTSLLVTVLLRGVLFSNGNDSSNQMIIMSGITMGVGLCTTIYSMIEERRKYKKSVKDRISQYNGYIESKEKEITEFRKEEHDKLENIYYSTEKEEEFVNGFEPQLFDRDFIDEDFLAIRIGTGDVNARRVIDYKKHETFGGEDELQTIPLKISEKYQKIADCPVTIALKGKNYIGFVGTRETLYASFKNVVMDLSTRHYYTDLILFAVLSQKRVEQFNWLRFLPHIQNELLNMRNIVCDDTSKNILFEYLYKELSRREEAKTVNPQIVVLVYEDMGLKRHPISRYLDKCAELGVHFIFFDEYEEMLPANCSEIVRLKDHSGTMIDCSGNKVDQDFIYEEIDDAKMEKMVFKLAPIYCEEVSLEGALTKNISMFEMLNILSVEDIKLKENWEHSEIYKSMAAPLGVRTKDEIVYLDLHEKQHGPHGLVAGTTGSGKSEILQTYILSMATLFHPYEVGFVIIDFKGGGMVNQFKDLPHLIGSITNIDGREIDRSLLSIKAELRKRQTYFAKYGVNHIDQYIKLYKKGETPTPIPHLILIVDEFAELKMDQPEFMKELISAARIGRSLGVHLILATQKPSGVVDAQIWSNSKFKLCLKVANKEDSNEVLKTPLAAEIKEPGRAYLQVGNNEIFELFQSAYSGASSDGEDTKAVKSFSISKVDFSGRREKIYTRKKEKRNDSALTQLEAIVEYVHNYCEDHQIERLPGICLPPLQDSIDFVEEERQSEFETVLPLGVYDDPDNQYQGVARLNISNGNTVIIGSSQYGKTNLLQLILRGICQYYSPKEVNAYILDFASMALKVFENIHHIGGVVTSSDDEKLKNFFRMIMAEIKHRKEVFSSMGITSFASYKEAGKTDMAHLVIMIDNFIALKELYPDYEENLLYICREGTAVGVTMIITSSQSNGISYKYMSNFANRICLYCNQSDEYSSMFDRCRMKPKMVPGRGLIAFDKVVYEYQNYLAFKGSKEIERVEAIRAFGEEINQRYSDLKARAIPEVPQILDEEYVRTNYVPISANPYSIPIGIDYDSVDFVNLELDKTITIGITGREKSGRTNLTKILINYLQKHVFDLPSSIYVLDNYEKQMDYCSSYGIVERYTMDLSEFDNILNETEEKLKQRLETVQSVGIEGIANEPLILIVVQNADIYLPDGVSKATAETYKRIIKNYRNMKVCFLFSNVDNVTIAYGASEMLKQVKEYSVLFAMEDLVSLKVAEVSSATAKKFKKPIELGDGYMITEKGIQKLKLIHCAQ